MTTRQEEIMTYICNFNIENHNMPSYRKISEYFGISKAGSYKNINLIVLKGYLERKNNLLLFTQKGIEFKREVYKKKIERELCS